MKRAVLVMLVACGGHPRQPVPSAQPHVATGAEHVVPGMLVLFAFLSLQTVIMLFFREHAWGTWDRLRASSATTLDLLIGKTLPSFAAQLLQCAVVLAVSAVAYHFRISGSAWALVLVLVAFVAALQAFAVMLVAVFPTLDQAMVIGNLVGMVMAGLGGAFTPVSSLPGWAQGVAHASPAAWAIVAASDDVMCPRTSPVSGTSSVASSMSRSAPRAKSRISSHGR